MRSRDLYKLAQKIIFPELKPLGFETKNGNYVRELGNGVLHIISLAMDPHGQSTFRLLCGANAMTLSMERDKFDMGLYKRDPHLIPSGWDNNSGRWPCETNAEATESLLRIRELLLDMAIPWFDAHQTFSSVAEEIYQDSYSITKAKLYLLDGNQEKAKQIVTHYIEWMNDRTRYWYSQSAKEEALHEAFAFLAEMQTTKV